MYLSYNTSMGKQRSENQDKIRAGFLSNEASMTVVCDGMGGAASGSVASDLAANEIFDYVAKRYYWGMSSEEIREMLSDAIKSANILVYEKSREDIDKNGMGTTCVAALVVGKNAYIVNIGDSRAYLMNDSGVTQITEDHTYVNMLYKHGEISFEEMENHRMKNIITRAIGVDETAEPDFFDIEQTGNFAIFLCTDGLYNYCSPQLIYQSIFNKNLDKGVNDLIDYCNACGGKDNISAAVIAN